MKSLIRNSIASGVAASFSGVLRMVEAAKAPARTGRMILVIIAALSLLPLASAQAPAEGRKVVTIGLTKTAFLNVNRNDMEAALRVLTQTLVRKHGYRLETQTRFYEDDQEFAAAVRDGKARLAIMDSWTYLAMEKGGFSKPSFVSREQGRIGKQYLLLTRRDSACNALADLRGKDLTVFEIVNSSLGRPWLETMLLSNRLGSAEVFFNQVKCEGKPTTALLAVYFGKAEACLMDAPSFEVMTELNPQVGKKLRVIATSEPLLDGLQILSDKGWEGDEQLKRDVTQAISELHLEPAGQQLLTLFKTDQLAPFEDQHIAAVRRLRAIYDRCRSEPLAPAQPGAAGDNPAPSLRP